MTKKLKSNLIKSVLGIIRSQQLMLKTVNCKNAFFMTPLQFLAILTPKPDQTFSETFDKVAKMLLKYFTHTITGREAVKRKFPEFKNLLETWEPYESNFLSIYLAIEQLRYCKKNN